jgi:Holliday junction DNA helicase RuvA
LNLLNTYPPEKFAEIVLAENHKLLSQVSGIGPKTAQRIIVELKDRLKSLSVPRDSTLTPAFRDAFDALVVLGYTPRDAVFQIERIARTLPPSATVEEIVRAVLAGEGEVQGI